MFLAKRVYFKQERNEIFSKSKYAQKRVNKQADNVHDQKYFICFINIRIV